MIDRAARWRYTRWNPNVVVGTVFICTHEFRPNLVETTTIDSVLNPSMSK